jgi:two-component system, OmpR family, sensor histidine kinase KdpD
MTAPNCWATPPPQLILPEDRDVARAATIAMMEGKTAYPSGFRIVTKSGDVKWIMETVATIACGGKPAVLGTYTDITERKNIELEMHQIVTLNRLKSNLLSTVSHELRTPLATIKGYASMLLEYDSRLDAEEKLDGVAAINRAADRLTELVDHLLDLSRIESGLMKLECTLTDLHELLAATASEAQMRRPDYRIVFGGQKTLPEAVIDARRIRQVVDNLIDNAAKYSAKESEIIIDAECRDNAITVSVRDHGLGIPEADTSRIFERMYQVDSRTHRRAGGIGLGLAICKGLIDAHRGRIWVESREGKGSAFFFTLPLAVEDETGSNEGGKSRGQP